jgi:hypothetical protein
MQTRRQRLAEAASYPTPGVVTLGQRLAAVAELCVESGILLHEFELAWRRAVLVAALKKFNWNQFKAAHALGIHRNTMARAIEDCGLRQTLRDQIKARSLGVPKALPGFIGSRHKFR